ncbi:MAG: QueT transporter family protein [Bacillota bacterium]
MKKISTKLLTRTALIAAIYAVMTIAIAPLSYGAIQFRISEILVLFAFVDDDYIPGLILGCVLANLYSPLGMMDVIFGSMATAIAVMGISLIKKILGQNLKSLFIASLSPVVINGIIIGMLLKIVYNVPFMIGAFQVAIGEFVVVSIAGVVIFKGILESNLKEILAN